MMKAINSFAWMFVANALVGMTLVYVAGVPFADLFKWPYWLLSVVVCWIAADIADAWWDRSKR